jgi:fermentation-respiration switch protein FrsA (DUF1100 family)
VDVAGSARRGAMNVTSLTYVTFDGTRVPALLATPRGRAVSGCLMYQPGIGTPKEGAAQVWPGAAKLGLAVFTIDPRLTGARASSTVSFSDVRSNLQLYVNLLRDNVIDLRRGLDYLERLPSCHHSVGYMGWSQGAEFGVFLAGEDARIRTAVLCSIEASFRAETFYSPFGLVGVMNNPANLKTALTELAPLNQTRWIARISPRPVMIVNGLTDRNIPPAASLEISAAARAPKVVLLHPGGHDPFGPPDGRAVAARIGAFLTKTLIHGTAVS